MFHTTGEPDTPFPVEFDLDLGDEEGMVELHIQAIE